MWRKVGFILAVLAAGLYGLISCQGNVYRDIDLHPPGGDPSGTNTDLYLSTQAQCSAAGGGESRWGGVSCMDGSDQSFKDLYPQGTLVSPYVPAGQQEVRIACEPGNGKGILFHLSLQFQNPLQINGRNNNVMMSAGSSSLKMVVHDLDNASGNQVSITLNGKEGFVNGTEARLVFSDHAGTVRLEGSFASGNTFSGTAYFDNEKQLTSIGSNGSKNYGSGKKGILGSFSIDACSAFPFK